jgi:hypothetical protein
MEDSIVHFEVSFADPVTGRRTALAHSESQAVELAQGFAAELDTRGRPRLKDIQMHKVTTTREPYNVG